MYQRINSKSTSSNSVNQQKKSQFAPPAFKVQAKQDDNSSVTKEEQGNHTEDLAVQQKEHRSTNISEVQSGRSFTDIPTIRPDAPKIDAIQPQITIQRYIQGEQQQSQQESSETDKEKELSFAQKIFHANRSTQNFPVSPIQRKLTIGEPGDKYEQEADRVAAQVVRQINSPITQSNEEQSLQRQEIKEPRGEFAIQDRFAMGRREASQNLSSGINSVRGGGESLDAGLQQSMGRAMGADFSGVKIHTDAKSDQLNKSIQAKAFTTGQDVFFRQGAYEPRSRKGQELIAHELTHVVQQNGPSVQRSPLLPKNLQQYHVPKPIHPVIQRSPTGIIQRKSYAELDELNKARVDSKADSDYAAHAEEFEEKLGWHLSEAAPAVDAVNTMLDAVRKIVDAWADHTGQEKLNVYEQEFKFTEGDKYFGAFKMTGEAIKKVFDSRDFFGKAQPARKKLKVIYNAVRNNNLAKWLKVAADDMTEAAQAVIDGRAAIPTKVIRAPGNVKQQGGGLNLAGTQVEDVQTGFAADSGLDEVLNDPLKLAAIKGVSNQEKVPITFNNGITQNTHIAAPDMWSNLARGTQAEASQIDAANKDRLYNRNKDVSYDDQHTVLVKDIPNLTAHEIRLILERRGADPGRDINRKEKNRFKARADDKITWEQGRDAIMVMVNSHVEKAANAIGARLEAGISGSTNMMFVAAKNLGFTNMQMMQKLRLAMLGWMLPNHDHSFYEIMKAAEIQGVPFTTDPARKGYQYEAPGNYTPMAVNSLRRLLPENQFPMYFLSDTYKNELAGTQQGSHSRAAYRQKVKDMGIPSTIVNSLSDRAMTELIALRVQIKQMQFKDPTQGNADQQKASLATNRLRARYLQEGESYRYLAHNHPVHAEVWFGQLLAKEGKPLSDDQDMLSQVDQTLLPGLTANEATRKAALVTAGVPTNIVDDIPEHIINDLIQLKAVISRLPLDAAQPLQSVANQPHYNKLMAMPQTERLFQVVNPLARLILSRLLAAPHGELIARSVLELRELSPDGDRLMQAGIPDVIVRRILVDPNAAHMIADIGTLSTAIDGIVLRPNNEHIAALQALNGTYAVFKGYIDNICGMNRFDMIVAAIANRKGIQLSGNVHLKTLSRTASALNTQNIIDIPLGEKAGFGDFSINSAKQQLTQNLTSERRVLAGTPFENLRDIEIASIWEYTRLGGMGSWQGVLSNPDTTNRNAPDKLVKLAPKIEAAVSGLRKLPVAAGPVYSAARADLAGNPAAAMAQYKPGQIINQDNFLSTAKSVDASFIPKPGYGVAYVIDSLKSGRDIQVLSTNYGEEEVLFPPGSRLMVTKVENRSASPGGYGKVWISMLEV